VKLSDLTPEQARAALEAYRTTPTSRRCGSIVNLAEHTLCHMLESEHRLQPDAAASLALKYAEAAVDSGEAYMQATFENWLDTVQGEFVTKTADVETITKDDADADAAERAEAGEAVEPAFDPSAVQHYVGDEKIEPLTSPFHETLEHVEAGEVDSASGTG